MLAPSAPPPIQSEYLKHPLPSLFPISSPCHLDITFTSVVRFTYHKHPLWHERHSYLQGLRRHSQAHLRGSS